MRPAHSSSFTPLANIVSEVEILKDSDAGAPDRDADNTLHAALEH
jgi:hypothetical protein